MLPPIHSSQSTTHGGQKAAAIGSSTAPDGVAQRPLAPEDVQVLTDMLRAMRKRMFWFWMLFFGMVGMAIVGGVAKAAGINARSGGWESQAVIAGFIVFAVVMVGALVGFTVHHLRAHRLQQRVIERAKTLPDLPSEQST